MNTHNLPTMTTRAINAVLKGFDEVYLYDGCLVFKVLTARRCKGILQFRVTVKDSSGDKPFWYSGCEIAGWAILAWNIDGETRWPIVNIYRRLPNSVLRSDEASHRQSMLQTEIDSEAVTNFLRGSEGGAA